MNVPPWKDVRGGAVTSVRTWQIAHPIASKSADPEGRSRRPRGVQQAGAGVEEDGQARHAPSSGSR